MRGFFGRKSSRIPTNATFRLTQVGREKLQEFSGDPQSRVLVALETRGTSDIDELSHASGLSKGQTERILLKLMGGGSVQCITASMMADMEE